jgi:hypothetical protein
VTLKEILSKGIISYIGVRVRDVSQRFSHEAKAGEVAFLTLDILIPIWAGGVIIEEVKVAWGSTCSGHDLLELLLLVVVPESVLLFVVALVVRVILVGVVVLVGGVELLPLGAVGDDVGGVTPLEAATSWYPPLLAELEKGLELPHQ